METQLVKLPIACCFQIFTSENTTRYFYVNTTQVVGIMLTWPHVGKMHHELYFNTTAEQPMRSS